LEESSWLGQQAANLGHVSQRALQVFSHSFGRFLVALLFEQGLRRFKAEDQ